MRKTIIIPFITALFVTGCFSGKGRSTPVDETIVSSVSLNATSITISVDSSYQLQATVLPTTAEDRTVTWSSDDSDIASVRYGKVTGVAIGTTTVSAVTTDGGYKATCTVHVVDSGGTDDQEETEENTDTYVPNANDPDILIINTEYLSETYPAVTDNKYEVSITQNYKQIYVNAPNAKLTLSLEGVTITNNENSPIYVSKCDSIDISAKKNKTNTINDTREAYTEDVDGQGKAAILVLDGDLKLKGQGTLNVNANYYNGIHGKDDVEIQKLTLNVNALNHGIKGNDSLTITSGTINVVCGGDGLKTDNSDISNKEKQRGDVTINGGTITVNSWADAVDAAYNAVFEETNAETPLVFTAKTNKYSSYDGEVLEAQTSKLYISMNSSTYANGAYTYAAYIGGAWYKASYYGTVNSGPGRGPGGPGGQPGQNNQYVYFLERPTSATSFVLYRFSGANVTSFSTSSYNARSETKSFNTYYDTVTITVSGNSINLGNWSIFGGLSGSGMEGNNNKSSDSAKAIKAANAIYVKSGLLDLKAFDDGIHANADGLLENGNAPEGNIYISGGSIEIFASDDGMHADNITTISGGEINISNSYEGVEGNIVKFEGGTTTIVATDDGVNAGKGSSTPKIEVTGGYLDVTVNPNGDTDGIDSNGTYVQSGGVVIVRGPGSASGGGGGAFALDASSTISLLGGTTIVFGGIERTPTTSLTRTLCSSSSLTGEHTVSFSDGTSYACSLSYSYKGCLVYSVLGTATLN